MCCANPIRQYIECSLSASNHLLDHSVLCDLSFGLLTINSLQFRSDQNEACALCAVRTRDRDRVRPGPCVRRESRGQPLATLEAAERTQLRRRGGISQVSASSNTLYGIHTSTVRRVYIQLFGVSGRVQSRVEVYCTYYVLLTYLP